MRRITVLLLILLAFTVYVFRATCLHTYVVKGPSMDPNLKDSQVLLGYPMSPLIYLQTSDVVVVSEGGDLIVKRIIALPGDVVLMHQGHVYVNGHRLIEPYLPHHVSTGIQALRGPVIRAGNGQYIIMGDNRDVSSDSREFGPVDYGEIVALVKHEAAPALEGPVITNYATLTNFIPYVKLKQMVAARHLKP